MTRKSIAVILIMLAFLIGCSDYGGGTDMSTTEESSTEQSSAQESLETTPVTETTSVESTYEGPSCIVKIYKDVYMMSVEYDGEQVLAVPVSISGDIAEGVFGISGRERWARVDEGSYAQYSLDVSDTFRISSALYYSEDINTLIRSSYMQIGSSNDGTGRISAQAGDVSWLYENCGEDTQVIVLEESEGSIGFVPPQTIDPEKAFTDPTDTGQAADDAYPYYIYIEKGSATITIYSQSETGDYDRIIKTYPTAVGKTPARTPVGIFRIESKERWHEFKYPYDGGFAQYACKFYNNIMIHSPIYTYQNIDSMITEFYYEIGMMKTAGCLRTYTEASYWIYAYCAEGTTVEIVNGSPREMYAGDLVPIDPDFPNTDPTDPFRRTKITGPVMGISDCTESGYVNIRSGPGTGYPVLARLGDKTYITVIEEGNGWYKVNFLNGEAYVIKDAIWFDGSRAQPFSERQIADLESSQGTEEMSDGTVSEVVDDLVDLRGIDDTIIIDLAFGTDDNFTGLKLYPNGICMLQRGTALKLAQAQETFREKGYSIKVVDAYRPLSVQYVLFDLINDPKYIADPSRTSHHNRGAAVDITLVDSAGNEVRFASPIHSFTDDSSSESQKLDEETKELFEYMVSVMEDAGFYNYDAEWWHFSDLDYQQYMVTDHDLSKAVIYNGLVD